MHQHNLTQPDTTNSYDYSVYSQARDSTPAAVDEVPTMISSQCVSSQTL